MAIIEPAPPDITPHTSPTTSLQKLDTCAAFCLNLTAISAPFTFLEFIELKGAISAAVTATPIISNRIPNIINIIKTIKPIIILTLGIIDSDNILNTKDIEVTTSDGKVYKAKVLTIAPNNRDLALIKIEHKTKLKTVKFGDSDEIKIGQRVLTIGNPFGFSGTLTQGIISRIDYAKGRIQTDAAINPGCSGGPLLNLSGEVIGINQAIYNPDNNISNIGIGFAIPINEAKRIIGCVR